MRWAADLRDGEIIDDLLQRLFRVSDVAASEAVAVPASSASSVLGDVHTASGSNASSASDDVISSSAPSVALSSTFSSAALPRPVPLDRSLTGVARAERTLALIRSVGGCTSLLTADEWMLPSRPKAKVVTLASLMTQRPQLTDHEQWRSAQLAWIDALAARIEEMKNHRDDIGPQNGDGSVNGNGNGNADGSNGDGRIGDSNEDRPVPSHALAAFLADVEMVFNETQYYRELSAHRQSCLDRLIARVHAYALDYVQALSEANADEDLFEDFKRTPVAVADATMNSSATTGSSISGSVSISTTGIAGSFVPPGAIVLAFDRVQPLLADENYPAQTCDDISALIARHSRALRQVRAAGPSQPHQSIANHPFSPNQTRKQIQFCSEYQPHSIAPVDSFQRLSPIIQAYCRPHY